MMNKRRSAFYLILIMGLLTISSCGGGGGGSTPATQKPPTSNGTPEPEPEPTPEPEPEPTPEPEPNTNNIDIDAQVQHQTISGFGAALPMWTTDFLSRQEVKTLVGLTDEQLGLSIIRTIIRPDQNDWVHAVKNLQVAETYIDGVQLYAAPWSPPAEWKDNNDVNNGGKLLKAHYEDYANHLNNYVSFMADQGVTIDVVSIQNEPDWHPDYESCDWTGEEFRDFLREHGDIIQSKVMIGESLRFDRNYSDPSLNDELALEQFEIVGGHLYSAEESGTFVPYPLAEEKGKERWMTEWNYHEADKDETVLWGGDNIDVWNETLDVIIPSVHRAMVSNWNAYVWWWVRRYYSFIGDGELGTTRSEVLKRGWAFSHYSKYVRPGYVRIDANTEMPEVDITAYDGEDRIVLVIVNRADTDYTDVALNNTQDFVSERAYITSQSRNRETLTINKQDNQISLPTLPARSVVTVELFITEPPAPWQPAPSNALEIEMESLAMHDKFSPFVVVDDVTASGGKYVVWPNNETDPVHDALSSPDLTQGGYVEVAFSLTEDTTITFEATVDFSTSDDDSFYYRFDDGDFTFPNTALSGWSESTIASAVSLTAGSHTLTIQRRENGAKIDKISLLPAEGIISLVE